MPNAFTARQSATNAQKSKRGPLAALSEDGKGGAYDFSRTTYPSEGLGTTIPSYIMFFINLPDPAKYTSKETFVADAFSVSDQNVDLSRKGQYAVTDPIRVAATTGVQSALMQAAGSIRSPSTGRAVENAGESLGRGARVGAASLPIAGMASTIEKKPKLQRIKEAIAIYMPDTAFHTSTHDYDTASLTTAMGDIGLAQRGVNSFGGGIDSLLENGNIAEAFKTAYAQGGVEQLGRIAEATGTVGGGFTDFALRSQGKALNPQVELLFRNTANRSFVFDFRFQPKTQQESDNIRNIIYLFRRYAAPDLAAEGEGAYFIPPGEFDIQYCFKQQENDYLGRISTCVLENIDVNYSSAGQYATFYDGAPVEINMQLRFKEVDIITRDMVDAGF